VTVHIDIDIQPAWTVVGQIRSEVERDLAEYPADVRAATVMAASELVENAVKYGERVPGASRISFSLRASDDVVRIDVTNGATDPAGVAALCARIDAVAHVQDRTELYLRRLEELIASPTDCGRLGLYRVAHEGAFDLSCTYQDSVVTVTAIRRMS
jgi:hypothetical protein